MAREYDLAVIGTGPAGAATAISAASRGLSVLLLDRARTPQFRPGECLHPGVEPLLREFRVWDAVVANAVVRPTYRRVKVGPEARFEPFGADRLGSWRAIHIARSTLDEVLFREALRMGADSRHVEGRLRLLRRPDGTVAGVEAGREAFPSRYVIDATGSASWLNRQLELPPRICSPRMTAFCGYCEGALEHEQSFESDERGWRWLAQVDLRTINWTALHPGSHTKPPVPEELSALPRLPPACRGFDVTWRRASSLAGPGYFVVGEAAFVLDPASGDGVLHALMSGMYAGEAVIALLEQRAEESTVHRDYETWSARWFAGAIGALSEVYGQHFPDWGHPIPPAVAEIEA